MRDDRSNDRRDGRDRERDGRDKRDREREWGDRDRGGYSRSSNNNSSAGANPVRDALVVSSFTLIFLSNSYFL